MKDTAPKSFLPLSCEVSPYVDGVTYQLLLFDIKVIDGIVNTIGGTVRLTGSLLRYIQTGIATSYALYMILGVILVLTMLLF